MNESIGKTIKHLRKQKGLTQAALGALCGMPDSQIRKYESGTIIPKPATLERIAAALDVELQAPVIFKGAEKIREDFRKEFDLQRFAESVAAGRPDLLSVYNSLNTEGQDRVYNYASDLADNPKYQAAPPEPAEE